MSRGPWNRRKPREYYTASKWNRVQWACGIPQRFWGIKQDSVVPSSFQYENKDGSIQRIASSTQQEYLNARIEHPELLTENRLICITSYPSDEHGLAAACLLASKLVEKQWAANKAPKVRIDDIQDYEQARKLQVPFFSVEPDMLLIHNLNDNTSRERLSLVRDILLSFEGTYRGVVAAADNPLKFARETLRIEPHESYHFEGRPRKIIVK